MTIAVTGDSPQAIAYKLMEVIAHLERKCLADQTAGATRKYVLSTYKECINAVLDIRKYGAYGS
jgi:hypothetical protein